MPPMRKIVLPALVIVLTVLGISVSASADDVPSDKEVIEIDVIDGRKGPVEFSHKEHATTYEIPCAECHAAKLGTYQHKPTKKAPEACATCHAKIGESLIKVRNKKARALGQMKEGKVDKTSVVYHPLCLDCHKKPDNAEKTNAAGKIIWKCRGCHPREAEKPKAQPSE